MTTPAERYRDLAEKFGTRVEAVPDDRWDHPSPCEGWSTRDVLRHVIDSQHDIVKVVDLQLPAGPSVDDDPAGAWSATRDGMQAILDDPALAERTYEGHFGPTNLAATVANFHCFDLVVHGWDLAQGAGIDSTIAADDLAWVAEVTQQLGASIRMAGVCGPEVQVPADSDQQTRTLAMLGRRA